MDVRRAFAVAVLVTSSVAVSAQAQFKQSPEKDPYRNLFDASARLQQPDATLKVEAPTPQTPVVVCGMRIIPVDPQVDPKIRVAPPAHVEHSLRTVTPPVCHPSSAHIDPNSRRR